MAFSRIAFELTTRCNLKCTHCIRDNTLQNVDLSLDMVRKVLSQAKMYGVCQTAFTGGEPTLNPQFEEIIRETMNQGFQFALISNGTTLKKWTPLLLEAQKKGLLMYAALSLEGPDAETNDAIRGQGTFKRVIETITRLHAHKIPIVIKHVLNKVNHHSLEAMALFASHLEVDRLEISHMHPTPDNMAAGLVLDPQEWIALQPQIDRLKNEFKLTIAPVAGYHDPAAFTMCSHLCMTDLYVDVKGRLCVCCMLPGMRGAAEDHPELDAVADLNKVDLWQAHEKLVDVIADFYKYRISRIAKQDLSLTDHFQCIACAKYFGKIDWIKDFPQSPWSE